MSNLNHISHRALAAEWRVDERTILRLIDELNVPKYKLTQKLVFVKAEDVNKLIEAHQVKVGA